MERIEYTKWLRTDEDRHHNCCQSMLMSLAGEMGLTEEQAFQLGANMGAGMRTGATCGVITGALLALGAMGYTEKESRAFLKDFLEKHGTMACVELLTWAKEHGVKKKEFCDGLVLDGVTRVEELTGAAEQKSNRS